MRPSEGIRLLREKIGDRMNQLDWKNCCRDWYDPDEQCDCVKELLRCDNLESYEGIKP